MKWYPNKLPKTSKCGEKCGLPKPGPTLHPSAYIYIDVYMYAYIYICICIYIYIERGRDRDTVSELKDQDLILRPKTRGIPETMVCRILITCSMQGWGPGIPLAVLGVLAGPPNVVEAVQLQNVGRSCGLWGSTLAGLHDTVASTISKTNRTRFQVASAISKCASSRACTPSRPSRTAVQDLTLLLFRPHATSANAGGCKHSLSCKWRALWNGSGESVLRLMPARIWLCPSTLPLARSAEPPAAAINAGWRAWQLAVPAFTFTQDLAPSRASLNALEGENLSKRGMCEH